MPVVTGPADVTGAQLVDILRARLGPRYRVESDTTASWGFGGPAPGGGPDSLVVATGSGRLRRTAVRIHRGHGRAEITIEPPGPVQLRLINTLGIAAKVRRALLDAPELQA